MKNLVLVVLLVVVAIVGYDFMNRNSSESAVVDDEKISMIAPADMSEEARDEMYTSIMEYNSCMLKNRLEYHQKGNNAEQVANKTLAACETYLDTLAATLLANDVNEDLRRGLVMTMRKRAARKLMSAVTQSLAGQAAAAANAAPVKP